MVFGMIILRKLKEKHWTIKKVYKILERMLIYNSFFRFFIEGYLKFVMSCLIAFQD